MAEQAPTKIWMEIYPLGESIDHENAPDGEFEVTEEFVDSIMTSFDEFWKANNNFPPLSVEHKGTGFRAGDVLDLRKGDTHLEALVKFKGPFVEFANDGMVQQRSPTHLRNYKDPETGQKFDFWLKEIALTTKDARMKSLPALDPEEMFSELSETEHLFEEDNQSTEQAVQCTFNPTTTTQQEKQTMPDNNQSEEDLEENLEDSHNSEEPNQEDEEEEDPEPDEEMTVAELAERVSSLESVVFEEDEDDEQEEESQEDEEDDEEEESTEENTETTDQLRRKVVSLELQNDGFDEEQAEFLTECKFTMGDEKFEQARSIVDMNNSSKQEETKVQNTIGSRDPEASDDASSSNASIYENTLKKHDGNRMKAQRELDDRFGSDKATEIIRSYNQS